MVKCTQCGGLFNELWGGLCRACRPAVSKTMTVTKKEYGDLVSRKAQYECEFEILDEILFNPDCDPQASKDFCTNQTIESERIHTICDLKLKVEAHETLKAHSELLARIIKTLRYGVENVKSPRNSKAFLEIFSMREAEDILAKAKEIINE